MINKIISIAENEVGYLEKKSNSQLNDKTANAGSNNYTKYGAWYDGGSAQAQPWCAIFVSWCANQAGISKSIFYPHAYCPYGVTWYKDKKQWYPAPQPGDLIYFKSLSGGTAHVGIVYKVDSSKVYTIEGNTSGSAGVVANGGGVFKKSYSLSYGNILGYGRPAYQIFKNEEEIDMDELRALQEKVDRLSETVSRLADLLLPKYGYIDNNMPEWARSTIQKLCNKSYLKGDENGNLQLSYSDLRFYVVNDRAGVYGK